MEERKLIAKRNKEDERGTRKRYGIMMNLKKEKCFKELKKGRMQAFVVLLMLSVVYEI